MKKLITTICEFVHKRFNIAFLTSKTSASITESESEWIIKDHIEELNHGLDAIYQRNDVHEPSCWALKNFRHLSCYRDGQSIQLNDWPGGFRDILLLKERGGECFLFTPDYIYMLINENYTWSALPGPVEVRIADGKFFVIPCTVFKNQSSENKVLCYRAEFNTSIAFMLSNVATNIEEVSIHSQSITEKPQWFQHLQNRTAYFDS